jgi:PBSX family phage portal protein
MTFKDVRRLQGLDKNFIRKADRRLKNNGAGTKQIESEAILGYNYLDCVTPPHDMETLAKTYDVSPAHHAAVDAKVASVFGLGYQWVESNVYKRAKENTRTDGGLDRSKKAFETAQFALESWIDEINPIDCFEEVLRKIGVDYETTGNAYIEIGRDVTGKIGYIGHVPSRYMRIRRERDGFVQVFSNQVVFFNNFGIRDPSPITTDTKPNEIIHLKKYSPDNWYYGIPDVIAAQNAVAGNEYAARYNIDYFDNKAVPRHVIVAKGSALKQSAIDRLVEFFETGLKGQHHRSIFVPLPKEEAAIEFHNIEKEIQDSSFGTYRESNNEEIFMAHRIPASRAGVFSKNVSLAASRDADKVFKEAYSRPEQAIFEKKFNKIVKEITPLVVLKLNELSLIDEDVQSKIDERDVRMGIVVPDEVRSRRGNPPRPDGKGNDPWQANSQQAADQKAQANASRTRDRERSNENSDSENATGRQSKGEGRRTE